MFCTCLDVLYYSLIKLYGRIFFKFRQHFTNYEKFQNIIVLNHVQIGIAGKIKLYTFCIQQVVQKYLHRQSLPNTQKSKKLQDAHCTR